MTPCARSSGQPGEGPLAQALPRASGIPAFPGRYRPGRGRRQQPDRAVVLSVRAAVESLPERLRTAVLLHYFADLSVADVARQMSKAEGTITRDLHEARAHRPGQPGHDPVDRPGRGAGHLDRRWQDARRDPQAGRGSPPAPGADPRPGSEPGVHRRQPRRCTPDRSHR
ncbi:sigma factor-like helix-turn-helix DNA-binding protein [Ornithinimicrobium sp. Y1847]|uniref:sigma-70 region 4 domain-containing protein n=1 Tax=unclassified Ornithinimicrobium TaxID=2615080 RepID=UPI003B680AA1